MAIMEMLYTVLFMPLKLFFEVIYLIANRFVDNPGISIFILSLAINFLVLPLYKRADAIQEEERDMEAKLHDGVAHIKKTFKGDERMMILQAYYRQNNYRPTDVFKGSISLFLEIPFFIAAYQFLSNLELLKGVSFGVIADLGAADGLIQLAGMQINLLPIVMTAVNLVSCVIFTKGFPVKTKVQLYSMAIFFLVFLYDSPSGLVLYWTLNNIFSLVKTIFYKLKNPKKVLMIMAAMIGIALMIFGVGFYHTDLIKRKILIIGLGVLLILPSIIPFITTKLNLKKSQVLSEANGKISILGGFFLAVLIGVAIPSSVIKASPQEFVDVTLFYNPVWYIVSAFCLAVGTFVVWMGVFYWLTNKKSKGVFELGIWVACGVAIVNYMFFGNNLGNLTKNLVYEKGMDFTRIEILKNLGILLLVFVVLFLLYKYAKKYIPQVLMIGTLALGGMGIYNIVNIQESVSLLTTQSKEADEMPSFTLSKEGKNVVVLMMDRALGELTPYLMNENPKLKEQFDGFTYYPNTISFGGNTNFGSPALFGGYEYTPVEINKRDTELLVDKQNEALKVMPVLFDENGYKVTVFDPSYAGYQWVPDLSIYDEYPDIRAYHTAGVFSNGDNEQLIPTNKRNFFCYGLMKSMPLVLQTTLYNEGAYNHCVESTSPLQITDGPMIANGVFSEFTDEYSTLQNFSNMTTITEGSENTFLMMTNETTHEPQILQEPAYEPQQHVDNTEFEAQNSDRYTVDGKTLKMETWIQYGHYEVNMASMKKIGDWLDYLKENDVYDNTRIIIVADHGYDLRIREDLVLGDELIENTENYYPLLMTKDFNQEGFSTSEEFMTNGDVPTMAMDGLINDPVNPFTGNEINNEAKNASNQYIWASDEYDVLKNNGTVFCNPGFWYSVHTDRRDLDNWTKLNENEPQPKE